MSCAPTWPPTVGWAKRSVPTGLTAVQPVGTLRLAHPTYRLAHEMTCDFVGSRNVACANLAATVGWAKRSVPTGLTAVQPVGTLRLAHPTYRFAHEMTCDFVGSRNVACANLAATVGWAKRSVPTGLTAVQPVGTLRLAHPTYRLAHEMTCDFVGSRNVACANLAAICRVGKAQRAHGFNGRPTRGHASLSPPYVQARPRNDL